MKKIILIWSCLLLLVSSVYSQLSTYTFSQTAGTYISVTGGTTLLNGLVDSGVSPVTSIGFTFNLDGTNYTHFSATSNGWMRLGATAGSTYSSTPISLATNMPSLAAFARDGKTNGAVVYSLTGSAPNRVLTVEWPNWFYYWGSTGVTNNFTMQVKLYETTNVIEFVYGPNNPVATYTGQCGIAVSTTNYANRTTTTNWAASTAGTANTNTMTLSTTVKPASGLTYSWTPPLPCTGTPTPGNTLASVSTGVCPGSTTNLSLQTATTGSGVTYQWQSSADGVTYSNITGATTSTYTATVLSNTYFQCNVTCSGNTGTSTPVYVTIAAAISSYPWTESFETLPSAVSTTTFPTCWKEAVGTQWATASTASDTYTDPRTGTNYLRLQYGPAGATIWTPGFALVAGNVYSFNGFAMGDNLTGWTTTEVVVNETPSVTGLTVLGNNLTPMGRLPQSYTRFTRSFVCDSTGIYYFGIRATGTSAPWYLGFDDFSLVESVSCSDLLGSVQIIGQSALCQGDSIDLSANVVTNYPGVSYSWQQSMDGGISWSYFPSSNGNSLTEQVNSPIQYRAISKCDVFSDSLLSAAYSVNVNIPEIWTLDQDADGFGNGTNEITSCIEIIGYSSSPGDCDDSNPNINPSEIEICYNLIDENCDAMLNNGCDMDGDGFLDAIDCAPANPNIYPGANEICGNGIDEDCSGVDLTCVSILGCTNSIACNYNSSATQDDGSCVLPLTPAVIISSSDADNTICLGDVVVFTATPSNGGIGPTYQWKLNGANVGTNSATYTNSNLSNGAVVTVVMTANNVCQTSSTANGNSITTTVWPNAIMTNVNTVSVCSGSSVNLSLTSNVSSTYSWVATTNSQIGGESITAQTGNTINDVLTNSTSEIQSVNYTVTPISTSGTCPGSTQTVTVSVIPNVTLSNPVTQTICSGTTLDYSFTSNIPASYTWSAEDNLYVTGESTTLQNSSSITNTLVSTSNTAQTVTYNITVFNDLGNCNSMSHDLIVTINPTPVIVNSETSICSGQTFGISPTSVIVPAGTTYSWSAPANVNITSGLASGNAQSNISATLVSSASSQTSVTYVVTPTSDLNCIGTNFNVIVTIYPTPIIGNLTDTICSGQAFSVIPVPTLAGNNIPLGTTYSWPTPIGTGFSGGAAQSFEQSSISQVLTSNTAEIVTAIYSVTPSTQFGCPGNPFLVIVNINPNPTVTLTSSDADNSICSGTSVTFTATPTNGGTAPSYQWKLNGAIVGTNSATYTNSALTNGAVVSVVMTANNACQTSSTVNGNSITTSVLNSVTPTVAIVSNDADNSICSGTSVTFTASPTNGGTAPIYQWKLNGANVGTNSATYTNSSLTNGAVVTIVMTANNACQTSSTVNGNSITTSVLNNVTPTVAIASNDADNSICSGASATFIASSANGGITPSYQWLINGMNTGLGGTSFESTLNDGDVISVVLFANNVCQIMQSVVSNSITITVNPLLTWYADADADGFGNPDDVVQDCNQPQGYIAENTDCNDEDTATYPGAAEICDNNRDENCDGVDSLCFVPILGCTDINACNFNPEANTEDNSCILPQPETCNGLDDNCDGQVDEGLNLTGLSITPGATSLYPVCSGNSLKAANLTLGSNSAIIDGEGNDLWFSINAQFNTLRAGLSAASGDNDVRLYTMTPGGCLELIETEHENTNGNQTLLSDQLTVGQTYYVAVHNISGPMNASAKICFNHLNASTCDHYYSNNTGIYSSVCNSFKAQYRANAVAYTFDVLSATQNSVNQNITPWSYTTTSASTVVARLGTLLPANQGTSSMVYTLKVPVLYSLFDAAGNFENLFAQATSTCTVTLSAEATIALRSSDRCPTNKSLTSTIAPDRTVCGAMRYDWEFTEVLPNPGAAQVVQGGAYASVFFLSNVPGITVGKTYSVRVRPVHISNIAGQWGTAYCLRVGAAGMVMENHPGSADADPPLLSLRAGGEMNASYAIYPNPTTTGSFVLQYNGSRRGELTFAPEAKKELMFMEELVMMDITGKIVFKTNVVLNGNVAEINFGELESGLYLVDFGGERSRLQVVK